MPSLRSKLLVQFFVTNGATLAGFLLSIYIARLLRPAEIGIFSMAAVLVAFSNVFRDFGVVSFIRSQKTLTTQSLRAAMGVMVCASWSFAMIVYLAGPFAASYYKQQGVEDVMKVLAAGFLFIPIGSIPQAVLARKLAIRVPTIVTAVSVLAYTISCISFARLGFSYMSFAWANLINIIVTAATYSVLRPKGLPWLPSFKGWHEVISFGGGTIICNSIKSIDAAMPDLILGKLSGAHFVGLFSRGSSTVNILNYIAAPTINFATLPYLAQIHHRGTDVAPEVRRLVAYLTGVTWPALAVLALVPRDVILVLYGPAWLECASIIPALCIVAGIQFSFTILQPAFTALGRPYLAASPLLVSMLAKATLAVVFFDGTMQTFATTFALGELVSIPAYVLLAWFALKLSLADWVAATWRSAAMVVAMLGALNFISPVISTVDHSVGRLLMVSAFSLVVWSAMLLILRHPLAVELIRAKTILSSRFSQWKSVRPVSKW